jgi:hypothetical protein
VHVLTKVLVVFAAILSVALSALVIAYAVNTDRIAADYGNMQRTKLAVETTHAAQLADWNNQKATQAGRIEQVERELADAKNNATRLDGEAVNLRADLAKEKASRTSIESKIAELGETAKTQAEIIKNYREEVTTLRSNELGYRTRQAELDDRISDLESQREVLEQNYRALQEQIAEAKRTQEKALTGANAGSDKAFVWTGSPINGRIEEVRRDPSNKKLLAKISVGTNDRVAKNMKFYVVRGSDFLGNLVVTEPDLKWSLGEIVLQTGDIREGDLICSRIQ